MNEGTASETKRGESKMKETVSVINGFDTLGDPAWYAVRRLERELAEAKDVLRIVLNGGIDDGLDWQQVLDKVRNIVKPNNEQQAKRKGELIDF